MTRICIFPNRGGVGRQEARTQTLFHICTITPLLPWGCITTAAKQWTQVTFEISFPQMTHDSLSAVKIKQNPLWIAPSLLCWEIKIMIWRFCVRICMCAKRNLSSEMVLVLPNGRASVFFSSSTVERYYHQSISKIKCPPPRVGAPNSSTDVTLKHHFLFIDTQSFSSQVCQVPARSADPELWRCVSEFGIQKTSIRFRIWINHFPLCKFQINKSKHTVRDNCWHPFQSEMLGCNLWWRSSWQSNRGCFESSDNSRATHTNTHVPD